MNNFVSIRIIHARYWLMMGIICFLVVARSVLKIQIPLASFLLVSIILCAMSTKEEIIAFLCSMAPFEMTFQYRYMLLIGAVFLVLKSRRYRFTNILPVFFMLIWDALHYTNPGIEITEFIRTFAVLITIGLVLIVEPIDYSDGLVMRSLAVMTLFSCLVTVYVNWSLTGYSFTSGERLGSTYEQAESFNALLNPNVGAFLCVLSICGLVILLKSGNVSRLDVPVLALLSIFVLLFQSRSAMISLTIILIVYLYINSRKRMLSTLKILIIVSALIAFGFIFFGNTINNILTRFLSGDFSSGRFDIFSFYHQFLMSDWKNLLFGVGLCDYNLTIAQQFTTSTLAASGAVAYVNHHMTLVVSHNNVQEIMLVWGLPGIILVISLLHLIVKHKRMSKNVGNYLALAFILLYTLQGQLLSSNVVMIGLLFSMVCMEFNTNIKDIAF